MNTATEYLNERIEAIGGVPEGDLVWYDVVEHLSVCVDALGKRISALEAAQQPAPVASWLESAVASIGKFAADTQGEYDGVALEHLPVRLLPVRALEGEMEVLGDEIARRTAPATAKPTRAQTVGGWHVSEPVRYALDVPSGVEYRMVPAKDFEQAVVCIRLAREIAQARNANISVKNLEEALARLTGEAQS
jgi:hypothetical protein